MADTLPMLPAVRLAGSDADCPLVAVEFSHCHQFGVRFMAVEALVPELHHRRGDPVEHEKRTLHFTELAQESQDALTAWAEASVRAKAEAVTPASDAAACAADIAALADAVRHIALVLATQYPNGSVHEATIARAMNTAYGVAQRRNGGAPPDAPDAVARDAAALVDAAAPVIRDLIADLLGEATGREMSERIAAAALVPVLRELRAQAHMMHAPEWLDGLADALDAGAGGGR